MATLRLVATDLGVAVGGRRILSGTTLSVDPGEMVAVTGPSGAGKTTLLLVAAGVLRADSGTVEYLPAAGPRGVAGDVAGDDTGWRAPVALVPQTLALAPMLTVAECVALPMQVAAVRAAEIRERTTAALAEVGLASSSRRQVTELSGGQRQRVAVARGLAMRPLILIADEATAELDGENQTLVLRLFAALAAGGTSVLLSTHDPLVVAACSRAFAIDDGQLVPVAPIPA